MSQKEMDWFRVENNKRDYAALSSEAAAISKRWPFLLGIGFVGLLGVAQMVNGRQSAFRHTFGEFGETAAIWALLICSVWVLVDFFRYKIVRARLHVLHQELADSGHSYDFAAAKWVHEPSSAET